MPGNLLTQVLTASALAVAGALSVTSAFAAGGIRAA
jgi:hypothetical protein